MATHDTHPSSGPGAGAEAPRELPAEAAPDTDPLSPLPRLARMMALATPAGSQGTPVSSGFRGLDRLLPAGGVCRGSLVEWIGGPASGAASLAFAVACRLLAARAGIAGNGSAGAGLAGTLVVVDRRGRFHPPALLAWLAAANQASESRSAKHAGSVKGFMSSRGTGPLVVVRPSRDEDEIWAIDQALRCPGVTAVVAWPERATSTTLRRWQVGARAGGAVGLLVRPTQARREPSWAQARLAVTTLDSLDGSLRPAPAGAAGEPPPAVRLVPSLAVRRLCVRLVEGPWACEGPPDARAAEVALDLATGREAFATGREAFATGREAFQNGRVGRGDRAGAEGSGSPVAPEGERGGRGDGRPVRPDGRTLPGGVQCRAS